MVPESFIPLPARFYRPSARVVARQLLGHLLVRNTSAGPCGGMIVETEAYLADDPACHGFRGHTARNRSMYGPPGRAYVYFIYGTHYCFNTVCCERGVAEAVLIRALDPAFGEETLRAHRPGTHRHELLNGPAKLCQAMAIDRRLDGVDLCDPRSPIFVARNPTKARFCRLHGPVVTTVRIGITKAAELPLRFYLQQNRHVSRRGLAFTASSQPRGRPKPGS